MHWKPIIAGIALMFAAAPSLAMPPPYTAFYEAFAYGNTLKTRSSVNYEPGRVRMSLDARILGFLRLFGRFELSRETIIYNGPEGLRLLESHHSRTQPRRSREVHTRIDWETGMAEGTENGERFSVPVNDGTLDYLSVLLVIMQELRTGVAEPLQSVEIIERDRVREYGVVHEGTERLETELGRLDTVKVTRRDDDRGIGLSAWFARDLHYVPVRFDYEADGRVYVLNITGLDWH
jgi:hypothetical protein